MYISVLTFLLLFLWFPLYMSLCTEIMSYVLCPTKCPTTLQELIFGEYHKYINAKCYSIDLYLISLFILGDHEIVGLL